LPLSLSKEQRKEKRRYEFVSLVMAVLGSIDNTNMERIKNRPFSQCGKFRFFDLAMQKSAIFVPIFFLPCKFP
jgi:hypothetical protein